MRLLCHEFGGGHLMRLKKSNFETLYCFLRQLVPEVPLETIVPLQNEAHCEEPGCKAPHKYAWFCMIWQCTTGASKSTTISSEFTGKQERCRNRNRSVVGTEVKEHCWIRSSAGKQERHRKAETT